MGFVRLQRSRFWVPTAAVFVTVTVLSLYFLYKLIRDLCKLCQKPRGVDIYELHRQTLSSTPRPFKIQVSYDADSLKFDERAELGLMPSNLSVRGMPRPNTHEVRPSTQLNIRLN